MTDGKQVFSVPLYDEKKLVIIFCPSYVVKMFYRLFQFVEVFLYIK